MEELEKKIVQWAEDRGIFANSTPTQQALVTDEEVEELWDGITAESVTDIEDAIGDIAVTLVVQAKMHGLTLEQCMETAYKVISKRKGKMVDGRFVKEED